MAFFLKANLFTEAIVAKGTSRSQNNEILKFKFPKNKLKRPELSSPLTTATYTVTIPSIHSSVVSENKQEESTQCNVTNTWTAATPTTSTPESYIGFDVEIIPLVIKLIAKDSESVKPKLKQTKLSSYCTKK